MARNDGIDRTSARNQCVGEAGIGRIEGHNERENKTYTNPDIVPDRSWMNVHYKAPSAGYSDMFTQMEQDGQISTRGLKPDADHYCELVFDVNSAYFHNHGGYEYAKAFYAEAYKAAVDIVGNEKYILSAVMHADERNRPMSEALGYDVFHYHLHVVYIPVVEKQIRWTKRCKDPKLVGTVKETVMQVSASKKWKSDPVQDENGNPMRDAQGKVILKKSYSLLQDWFYDHMKAAGYTDIQRGEKGSTEEHLSTLDFKITKDKERLSKTEAKVQLAEDELTEKQQALADTEQAVAVAEKELLMTQKKLDKLLSQAKNAEAVAAKIAPAEELLPKPPAVMTARNYWETTALPLVKKLVKTVWGLYQKQIEAQKEIKSLKQENHVLQNQAESSKENEKKAGLFDQLCKKLGMDEMRRLLNEPVKQKGKEKEYLR